MQIIYAVILLLLFVFSYLNYTFNKTITNYVIGFGSGNVRILGPNNTLTGIDLTGSPLKCTRKYVMIGDNGLRNFLGEGGNGYITGYCFNKGTPKEIFMFKCTSGGLNVIGQHIEYDKLNAVITRNCYSDDTKKCDYEVIKHGIIQIPFKEVIGGFCYYDTTGASNDKIDSIMFY